MELEYFNSLGGFTPDGREYAIYLGPDTHTPAPWVNVIANPNFGTLVSETGAGFTWYGNSQRNRLTGWSNDPVLDPASEAIYIRDEESGAFWSPTVAPIREAAAYRARHGAGYSVFEHNSHAIEQELTVFVPVDDSGGQPVKLQRLRLTNASGRSRRISITYYVELTLGENRETSQMHVITRRDEETRALFAENRYHPDYGERVTFVAITPPAESYSGDRTAFIGRNRSLARPIAMELPQLSERIGAGLDPCAALRVAIELAPGEHRDIVCMLGQAESSARARELVLEFQDEHYLEDSLARTRAWWDDLLAAVEVRTPERSADLLINRWLRYQSLSSRIWGRSGFYQSSGAYGFRDQLQDRWPSAPPGLIWRVSRSCWPPAASSDRGMFSTGGIRRPVPGFAPASRMTCSGCRMWWPTTSGPPAIQPFWQRKSPFSKPRCWQKINMSSTPCRRSPPSGPACLSTAGGR